MRKNAAFTLVEIVISVAILVLLLIIAVPSVTGVLADQRLHRSLDALNRLVAQAQERSVAERRPYVIAWNKGGLALRAETPKGDEAPAEILRLSAGDAYILELPAALEKEPPAEWIFWPSGNCEPAVVIYRGPAGGWTARYSPLTGRAELSGYAAK